jgi:DNA modification methylase
MRTQRTYAGLSKCDCDADFRKGIVLDPFMGSGTVALVAKMNGLDYIGIELNPEFIRIANERLKEAGYKNQTRLDKFF